MALTIFKQSAKAYNVLNRIDQKDTVKVQARTNYLKRIKK